MGLRESLLGNSLPRGLQHAAGLDTTGQVGGGGALGLLPARSPHHGVKGGPPEEAGVRPGGTRGPQMMPTAVISVIKRGKNNLYSLEACGLKKII